MTSDIQNNQHRPIGIFDSSIGAPTVATSLKAAPPQADTLPIRDTPRLQSGVTYHATLHQSASDHPKLLL